MEKIKKLDFENQAKNTILFENLVKDNEIYIIEIEKLKKEIENLNEQFSFKVLKIFLKI